MRCCNIIMQYYLYSSEHLHLTALPSVSSLSFKTESEQKINYLLEFFSVLIVLL